MKASDRFFVDGVRCRVFGAEHPVANLSVGGFYVASEQTPILGQILDLEMVLGERPAFRMSGRVTWVKDPGDAQAAELPRGFGIKIIRIDFQDKLAIVDFLKRIVHDEDGAAGTRAR
jgi:hypothetical protein